MIFFGRYVYKFSLSTGQSQPELPKDAGEKTIAWLDKLRYANGDLPTSEIRNRMQRTMQNNAAVFRTQETLEEGACLFDCILLFYVFSEIFHMCVDFSVVLP